MNAQKFGVRVPWIKTVKRFFDFCANWSKSGIVLKCIMFVWAVPSGHHKIVLKDITFTIDMSNKLLEHACLPRR